jgi:hypothetical protein
MTTILTVTLAGMDIEHYCPRAVRGASYYQYFFSFAAIMDNSNAVNEG